MKRKFGPHATTRLQLESLEDRRLLAVAAYQIELYSDDAGVPGEVLVDNTVAAGQTFFVRVTAEEFDPFQYGLGSASVDIDWDAVLIDVVESDFNLDTVITADLPLFQRGRLDNLAGSIDDLSGSAMLSGGAGRSIGNMRPETFALIRMQAGNETGTGSIELSQSESKTITVPAMVLQEKHLRFDTETITIVAEPGTAASAEPLGAPVFTDSAELSALAETAETPESVETPAVSEAKLPPPAAVSPAAVSPAAVSPAAVSPAAVSLSPAPLDTNPAENNPADTNPAPLNFDANYDGVFDLADFGLLNLQAATPLAVATENPAALPAEGEEADTEAGADGPTSPVAVDNERVELNFPHVCIPMSQADLMVAETWMDALAQAWLEDAEARRNRRGVL